MVNASENKVEVAVPTGERQKQRVPDTLDLAERAELAIGAIAGMLDADNDYQMYADGRFNRRPPVITKNFAIPENAAKHLEALPLLRAICGSHTNIDVDRGFIECLLGRTAEDGCVYTPLSALANPDFGPLPMNEPFAEIKCEGRYILALCLWHQRDGNPLWPELIHKKIQRLTELAVAEEDYVYYPRKGEYVLPNYFTHKDTGPLELERDDFVGHKWFPRGLNAHAIMDEVGRSLCVYYKVSGYEPALELAGKIVRGTLKRTGGFDSDGRWQFNHFHTNTASLLAMLEYALILEDDELLELVRKGYEFGKAAGASLTGFFPEFTPGSDWHLDRRINVCETCEVADMIGLALKLTCAGVGDYWEDADRWIRNQLVENQLTPDKLQTLLDNIDGKKQFEEKPVQPWEHVDVTRGIGGFAGWAFANDWGTFLSHACCTPNAGRTLYWIWDSIVTRNDDAIQVNLHLNHASPLLDINSHLPFEGRVDLRMKQTGNLLVRIPEGTDPKQVFCKVDDAVTQFTWQGNYISIQRLRSDQKVAVEFPIEEQTQFSVIGRMPCRVTTRGNTVVAMSPKSWSKIHCPVYDLVMREDDELCPLYQRDHYRQSKAPMKEVSRFVSHEVFIW